MDGLPRLKVYDAELTAYEDSHPFKPLFPIVDKSTYLGIEVEVENVYEYKGSSPYWRMKDDGSLRNNGREFVTPPIRAWRVEQALTVLLSDLNQDVEFTERTSIHVHMNIRTLTVAQLEALILTYLLFEKSLFNFVEKRRYNSVFCVPICETPMGNNLSQLILNKNPVFGWQKYTALNTLPIIDFGTIEFRHLEGTNDIEKIITWINLILSLKKFALRNDPEYIWHRIETLNTTSEYRMFGEEVFGTMIETIYTSNFNNEVEQCSIYIKNHCLINNFKNSLINNLNEKSPLYRYRQPLHTTTQRVSWPPVFHQAVANAWSRELTQIEQRIRAETNPTTTNVVPPPRTSQLMNDLLGRI